MQKTRGFSLIELLIAITILTLAIFPFMENLANNLNFAIENKNMFKAMNYSKELLEEIKLKAFDKNKIFPWSDIKANTENGRFNKWTSVEDYHNYNEKNFGIRGLLGKIEDKNFYRRVKVVYYYDNLSRKVKKTYSELDEEERKKVNTKLIIVDCYDERDELYYTLKYFVTGGKL